MHYNNILQGRDCECGIEPPGSISHGVSVTVVSSPMEMSLLY